MPQKLNNFENTEFAFAHMSNRAIRKAHYLFTLLNSNFLVSAGSELTKLALVLKLPIGFLLKRTIYDHFCAGEDLESCLPKVMHLAKNGVLTNLDYGVEAKQTEEELEKTAQHLHETLNYAASYDEITTISVKVTALIPTNLLKKVSLGEKLNSKEQGSWELGVRRVKFVCKTAYDAQTQVYIDAEESWFQPAIDAIALEMMGYYNEQQPIVFNTIQLYRHDKLEDLKRQFQIAESKGFTLAVKLVRGAYLEKENSAAEEGNYLSPIQKSKAATDRDYNRALIFCLERLEKIAFCNATHNEKSCLLLMEKMLEMDIEPRHKYVTTAQLLGMGDHISFNMAKAGYRVAKYAPYGPVKEVIPYLLRRANENTSVAGNMSRELKMIREEMKRRQLID